MADSSFETTGEIAAAGAEFGLADTTFDSRPARRKKIKPVLSVSLAVLLLAIAILVPMMPLADPIEPDYDQIAAAPGPAHLLGTDLHGRDELSRVLWAIRTSMIVGIAATGLALVAGIATGTAAVYGGRIADTIFMRTADVFLSFPVILGAIAIMAVMGPGRRNVFIAIAFFGWPVFARVFRSSLISVREKGFVKAARVLGAGESRIFFHHVLPNSLPPLVSYAAVATGGAILAEAGLSFINLGVQRPDPSLGLMLSESMGQFEPAPWLVVVPGTAVTMMVLVFILLGDSATRALSPGSNRSERPA
ncbi:MAG: ABC transporter permease [Actinobacteria bacterium]|nr:ABC transporter permease [Actinomycetota bacterium]